MERKIIWTERSSADIEAIVRYIARRDPAAAGRIGFGIFERVQILANNPEAGSALRESRFSDWRKLTFRRWKIVYVVRYDAVIIARVWPTAKGEVDFQEPL